MSDAHREARREEIVAAALRAVAAKGYSRTSMADVIAESGLSAGAIYGYFEGKGELLVAVAQSVLARRREEMAAVLARGPAPSPGEALAVLLRGLLRSGLDVRVLVQVWGDSTTDADLRRLVLAQVDVVRDVLGGALREWFGAHPEAAPDDPDRAAGELLPIVLALAQGFLVQRALFDDVDDEAYFAAVRDLLPH